MEIPPYLIRSSTTYILQTDLAGRVISANQFFKNYFSHLDIIGAPFTDLICEDGASPFNCGFKKVITKKETESFTLTLRLKAKRSAACRLTHWEFSAAENNGSNGAVMIGIGHNVEKPEDESVAKVRELEDLMFNSLPGIFYLQDELGNYIKWNENFETVSGYSSDEIPKLNVHDFVNKEDYARTMNSIKKAFVEGFAELELNIHTKNGKVIPYYFNKRRISYEGQFCLLGTGIDISTQVKAQEAAKQSERKYTALFEQASDAIMITDFKGNFTDANTSMCNMFGYSKQELLKKKIDHLLKPGELESSPIRFDLLAQGEHVFSLRNMMHKNGTIINVQANVKKFSENRIMAIARDVTELYKVQKEIELSEARFRGAFEYSPNGMALVSLNGKWLKVNRTLCNMVGYSENELFALNFQHITHPDDLKKDMEMLEQLQNGELDSYRIDKRYIHKNGTVVWIRLSVSGVQNNEGKLLYRVAQIEDITERKRIEEAIKESEERYRILVENAVEAVVVMDVAQGKFVSVSESAVKLFKMPKEELEKKSPLDISPEFQPDGWPSAEKAMAKINEAIEGGKPAFEWTHCDAEGNPIQCEVRLVRLPSETQVLVRGSIIEIGERKKIEAEKERMRYMLNERIKELTTLYRFSQALQQEQIATEDLLKEVINIIPGGWQFPEITAARIVLGDREYKTGNFKQSAYSQTASFQSPEGTTAMIEVVYLEERPVADEGPFFTEERNLLNMLAEMFRISLTRKEEAESLKKSEANLHTIFDSTEAIYVLLNSEFNIISYNKPAVKFASEELGHVIEISDRFIDYFPEERQTQLLDQLKKALSGSHVNYESAYRQPNGLYNWYDVRIIPISASGTEQEVFGVMLAVLDITQNKMMEELLLNQKIQEQKRITRAVLKAQEKERNYIGQELHDNICQLLVGTKLYLNVASSTDDKTKEMLIYPMELIDNSINEIRMLSSKQAAPQRNINLEELVQSLLDRLNENSTIQSTISYDVDSKLIDDDDLKLNIYRIIQEHVNNAVKHADCQNLSISIKTSGNNIHIEITDDGKGFNPDKKRKGIGISNMINRIESFNGEMTIYSRPGHGTKTEIRIPC